MRIINPKRLSYHNGVVENFNDLSKPMTAGMAFGFSDTKYTWLADFLFKHKGNTFINKHIGYVSFFSDKHTMYQEYKRMLGYDVYAKQLLPQLAKHLRKYGLEVDQAAQDTQKAFDDQYSLATLAEQKIAQSQASEPAAK